MGIKLGFSSLIALVSLDRRIRIRFAQWDMDVEYTRVLCGLVMGREE